MSIRELEEDIIEIEEDDVLIGCGGDCGGCGGVRWRHIWKSITDKLIS